MKFRHILTLLLVMLVTVTATAEKTYLVCVGINRYDNNENPLPCSRADVKGIANLFDKYNNTEVFMLLDDNATRNHILKVLKRQFAKAQKGDQIIFAYSGHGFPGGLSCYESGKVVFCHEIQDIMSKSKASRKVMFVNSCHSGSFRNRNTNRFDYRDNNTDVMMFLSSRPDESSWESSGMNKSFFFTHLIDGLRGSADKNADGSVTARELFDYVSPRVISDTDGMQHPQMFGKFSNNMVLVRLPK